MELIQVIVIAFAIFAISRIILRFRDRKMSAVAAVSWLIVWIAAIIVMLIPGTSFYFANILGIQRGADFVVYVSIVALFYLMFRIYVKIESVEKQITKVVRETAINKGKKR